METLRAMSRIGKNLSDGDQRYKEQNHEYKLGLKFINRDSRNCMMNFIFLSSEIGVDSLLISILSQDCYISK